MKLASQASRVYLFVVGKHLSIGSFSLGPYYFLYVDRLFEIAMDRKSFGMTKFQREMKPNNGE